MVLTNYMEYRSNLFDALTLSKTSFHMRVYRVWCRPGNDDIIDMNFGAHDQSGLSWLLENSASLQQVFSTLSITCKCI